MIFTHNSKYVLLNEYRLYSILLQELRDIEMGSINNYAESSDPFSCTSAWAPNQNKRAGRIFLAFATAMTSMKRDEWKRNAGVCPGAEQSSELKVPHACCGKNMVGNVTDNIKCVSFIKIRHVLYFTR